MKIAKFTIKRGDINRLIHSLQHLGKMADKETKARFVAVNLLENREKRILFKLFKRDSSLRVVVQIDRNNK